MGEWGVPRCLTAEDFLANALHCPRGPCPLGPPGPPAPNPCGGPPRPLAVATSRAMASLLSFVSEAWIFANSAVAFVAQAARALVSAAFASVIFAPSLGVLKLAVTRFELAAVTAKFSALKALAS